MPDDCANVAGPPRHFAEHSAAPAALLADYKTEADRYDELLATDGSVRAHFGGLFQMLAHLGPEELRRRLDASQRLIHEQGITYQIYDGAGTGEKRWKLDPLPLLMAPNEWRILEEGLVQRATVLDGILNDCYGPQELIRSRWLPPALVFAQPDFLRPCHGIRQPRNGLLHLYAADVARSQDGQWWVVSDRTQIPTGMGYALANRLVTSRILPEPFRDARVHRLAGFFRELQKTLVQLAPRLSDKTRVVMLTPGPHNETYFEQAYLARYLGYMLVEGQDLVVRDNHVFLKTLSGLDRVDVILRRVDDDFCDPLELRNDSILGVPGLLEALRAGNVALANPLGGGLVQSPAFMAFLPGLCKHLLGEELKLPSVATWWCGQETARKHVLGNLDTLTVKPAFRSHTSAADGQKPHAGASQVELRQQIEFDPDLFVAQERVKHSMAPAWEAGRVIPRPIVLRVFLLRGTDGIFRVMPGGLSRVARTSDTGSISMQQGYASKDTWVLSETPVEEITLLHSAAQNVELRRTGNNLPSRLADNFFWLGRYSERADATARLLRAALARFNPERTEGSLPLLGPLVQTLHKQGQLQKSLLPHDLAQDPGIFEAELLAAIFDPKHPGSLRDIVNHLQRLATFVRDRTSNDMWRVLSQLGDRLAQPAARLVMLAGDAVGVLNQILIGVAAFHGLARENMTRAQAWRFIDIGLRIERAIYIATLLESTLHSPEATNPSVLETALEVADSSITYRSRYNLLPYVPAVFDLILLDDKNPRSLLFQINQLLQHFEHLPREREGGRARAILEECATRLNNCDTRELAASSDKWRDSDIAQALRHTLAVLPDFSNAVAASYFAHSSVSRVGCGSEQ